MSVGACGISCDVCSLYVKGICETCTSGTEEDGARKKQESIRQAAHVHCPILACAVEKKVGYCTRDCSEFPCDKFKFGWESLRVQGSGPFPYSTSFLSMWKRRYR